jgi:hypothetical protein
MQGNKNGGAHLVKCPTTDDECRDPEACQLGWPCEVVLRATPTLAEKMCGDTPPWMMPTPFMRSNQWAVGMRWKDFECVAAGWPGSWMRLDDTSMQASLARQHFANHTAHCPICSPAEPTPLPPAKATFRPTIEDRLGLLVASGEPASMQLLSAWWAHSDSGLR